MALLELASSAEAFNATTMQRGFDMLEGSCDEAHNGEHLHMDECTLVVYDDQVYTSIFALAATGSSDEVYLAIFSEHEPHEFEAVPKSNLFLN